ncbi:DUF5693 family protein [Paenibacillus sp. MBLB4367]|uniref:DUF5693 family protein n=1 Tax=Paenibacillus sp. MBLB4367 TaxID=3384767 RepID=UPI0039083140
MKLLWGLVILGLLASLPFIYERLRTEESSKKVEFVFDYRDLLEISDTKTNPREFVNGQLDVLKKNGIHSLAVYESTLNELKLSRRIELYSSRDASIIMQTPITANENFAYVLFSDKESQAVTKDLIERAFNRLGVKMRPWSFKNQDGLIIEMPLDDASIKSLDPDPITLKTLKDKGFHIVSRLSNRRPFQAEDMDRLLGQLKQLGVTTILVDGDSVPGYSNGAGGKSKVEDIETMAELMNKYQLAIAGVEPVSLKVPPKGMSTLAKELHYNIIRLHSYSEQEADKLTENLTPEELEGRVQAIADRFVLAVKDRNIRMIFLNARASKNLIRGQYVDPLNAVIDTVNGIDGALERIEKSGYTPGIAHSFSVYEPPMQKPLKLLSIIGCVALIALMLARFVPRLILPIWIIGTVGALGLFVAKQDLLIKLLALAVTVSASTLAIMTVISSLRARADSPVKSKLGTMFALLLQATVISSCGAIFVVALMSHITFNLQLAQFTGVKMLAYLPVVLAAVYLIFFSEGLSLAGIAGKAKRILFSHVSVISIVAGAVILGAGYYYLSRTGNEGQASSFELIFRSFLENTLGVRPRTKEFLIGHPLFLLGVYLCLKRKAWGLYAVLIGAIAQADIVGTFTHLHTPLDISMIRVIYGLLFGSAIGLALIAVWELCARSWHRWAGPLKQL